MTRDQVILWMPWDAFLFQGTVAGVNTVACYLGLKMALLNLESFGVGMMWLEKCGDIGCRGREMQTENITLDSDALQSCCEEALTSFPSTKNRTLCACFRQKFTLFTDAYFGGKPQSKLNVLMWLNWIFPSKGLFYQVPVVLPLQYSEEILHSFTERQMSSKHGNCAVAGDKVGDDPTSSRHFLMEIWLCKPLHICLLCRKRNPLVNYRTLICNGLFHSLGGEK